MIGIVQSEADPASMAIGEALLEATVWTTHDECYRTEGAELRTVQEMHLDLEHPERLFSEEPTLLVVVSRHAGDTGPLLTGHFPGNFGAAEYGGNPRSLAPAAPRALQGLLAELEQEAPAGYETGIECTHHGPTAVSVPCLYAEVGSDTDQWHDEEAAAAVARSVLALRSRDPWGDRTVVGFGGPHYAPRYRRILTETPWSVGHICPDWALEAVEGDEEILQATFERSGANRAVLAGEGTELQPAIEAAGYEVVGERWLRAVGDRSLSLVDSVESALGTIGESVALGDPRTEDFVIEELPTQLVEALEAIDRDAVRAAVESEAVGFAIEENGNRLGDRVALPADENRTELLEAFAAILEREYQTVTIEEGSIHARREVFDPSLAREQGIPEGPAFGRLASGESIEVEGETIQPDSVHVLEERQFDW